MQVYLVAGLVRDLMVFHLLPQAHGAIPEREIYTTVLDGGWGGWGGPWCCSLWTAQASR